MEKVWRSLVLPGSIVLASVIIGIGLIRAGTIIGDSIKTNNNNSTANIVYELVRAINEKAGSRMVREPINQKIPEVIGSKKVTGITLGTNPIKGIASAPVLIVEFSDLQCPFTKRFYQQTFPQIEKDYIATGKVKFAYRDFTLNFHQFAKPAAILARCAGRQGKFWPMIDKLLSAEALDQGAFSRYIQELNLDLALCNKCQSLPEINAAMERDIQDASKLGVQGTPAFFINGRFVSGAQPYAVFKQIIDEELAKSSVKK